MVGDLDVLGFVEPIGTYEELDASSEMHEYKNREVRTIGLEDLIRVKEHIRRPKDQDSLFQLYGIRKVRAEQSGAG